MQGQKRKCANTAAVALLDRAYGRPAQSVEMDLKFTKNLEQMTLQELQELRERYAALALASPSLVIEHDATEQPEDVHIEADNEQGNASSTAWAQKALTTTGCRDCPMLN
jgi:hypothetical protein